MSTSEDLTDLLNYCKALIYGEKSVPFNCRQIKYHSNPRASRNRYIQFTVKKKSGGQRIIHAPTPGLKAIQSSLNLILQSLHKPSPYATGFVPGKSILDNAKIHCGSNYVFNIDLKDFFPSIDQARFWGRLKYPPFNLNENPGRAKLANVIAALCCHEMEVERLNEEGEWQKVTRFVLPQGAPTSPTISNIICQQLDYYLKAAANHYGLRYSRYADDITFSSMHNVYKKDGEFMMELFRILKEQNFHINPSKTRLQRRGYHQEVTGITVNEKTNVPTRYVKQIRKWLYYWENYGYEKASSYFLPYYMKDKGHIVKVTPSLKNVLMGKLDYLSMVKGPDNKLYQNLNSRFQTLLLQQKVKSEHNQENHLEIVLDLLFNNGLHDAMSFYRPKVNP